MIKAGGLYNIFIGQRQLLCLAQALPTEANVRVYSDCCLGCFVKQTKKTVMHRTSLE